MVIMASPRNADSVSSPSAARAKSTAGKQFGKGGKPAAPTGAPGFPNLVPPPEYDMRPDWPKDGPIDTALHDLPHASSSLEWWYHNAHITTTCGRKISLFSSFFRLVTGYDEANKKLEYGLALTSGLIEQGGDNGRKNLHSPLVLLDKNSPELFKKKLEKLKPKDPTMKNAFLEVLNRGKVPLPDRIANNMSCSTSSLNVAADGNKLVRATHGIRHMVVCTILLACLSLAIFWPKDIFPAMAEPKLDAWLDAVQAKAPAFLGMASGSPDLPVRLCVLITAVVGALTYSMFVLMAPSVSYQLELEWEGGKHSASLTFVPLKAPTRHGEGGVVHSNDGADMFYYFIPSCHVTGTVTIDGEVLTIASASGWYDHEFGGKPLDDKGKKVEKKDGETGDSRAWNWVSVQLDDVDVQISSAVLMDTSTNEEGDEIDKAALIIDADGVCKRYSAEDHGVDLVGSQMWRSTRSFLCFPTKWELTIPGVCELTLTAPFPDQELLTMLVGAFWEGRLEVTGTYMGQPVSGVGFAERNGFGKMDNLKDFFTSVGEKVRETVKNILPCAAIDGPDGAGSYEQHRRLVANESNDHLMNGLDTTAFEDVVLRPIRDVIDRGGKSWRAYGALACCDGVCCCGHCVSNAFLVAVADDRSPPDHCANIGPACPDHRCTCASGGR
jgi:predicted secreted hydrolase